MSCAKDQKVGGAVRERGNFNLRMKAKFWSRVERPWIGTIQTYDPRGLCRKDWLESCEAGRRGWMKGGFESV